MTISLATRRITDARLAQLMRIAQARRPIAISQLTQLAATQRRAK